MSGRTIAPGGAPDVVARIVAGAIEKPLGQSVIVENRTGANGIVGMQAVAGADPDGYALLVASASNAINATLYDNLNFNFIRDTAPIASIIATPLVMMVNPSFPAEKVKEFVAYANASPGKINMASSGSGSAPHVAGELFR